MMKILHIYMVQQGESSIALRYFWDNPFDYHEHRLPLMSIKGLYEQAEMNYYTRLPVDYITTGQSLYQWLDQSDRLLLTAIRQAHPEGLILAITASKGLAHLPWELLHDGESFLVEKRPPIIPVRWISTGQEPIEIVTVPQNRPLNVLFMATSPLGVEPVLEYEAEEAQILRATERTPVNLRVEESGCLSELSYMVGDYEAGFFDVFHLTGHAHYCDHKPCFLTESEYGDRVNSHIEDVVDALRYPLPSLIFLSGCKTGYAIGDSISSMAETLLALGATAVLGWGDRVKDADATAAASAFYQNLAIGQTVLQSIALTYRTLIQQNIPDWHKLRLYAKNTLPAALVTPPRTKDRKQLLSLSITVQFRDDDGRLRIANRENFVGRRRQLQNCLRILRTDESKVGVFIYGMGGLGKSSIASRLWDRLPEHEKILWWQQLNESYLIKKIKDKLISPAQLALSSHIENRQISLKLRLVYLFNQLAEQGEKPFLFIFDDFEWNLEPCVGRYVLKPEVAPILAALVEAIQETGTETRLLITCRYKFDSSLMKCFFLQGLEPLKKAELTKKLNRLDRFRLGQLPDVIRDRALALADGNPRLLEVLNDEVLDKDDADAKLIELEQNPERWKDCIIWKELYQLVDDPLQKVLSNCLVYNLPVPMMALEAICLNLPDYQLQLQRGQELGLLEVSADAHTEKRMYRVSRILPHILSNVRLPELFDVYELCQTAHETLYKLWGNQENESEEQWRELFRLKFANWNNPERFREGFFQMLAVQDNLVADRSLEAEMRRLGNGLTDEHLYRRLEKFLRQKNWKKADEETAFLFYFVMVSLGYGSWSELCENFPSGILNEIDYLWVFYSEGQFGFSVQKRIWNNLWEWSNEQFLEDYTDPIEDFIEQVGWYSLKNRDSFSLSFSEQELVEGMLPVHSYTRWRGVGVSPGEWYQHMRKKSSSFCFASLISSEELTYKN